jgi:hypothetical protein
MGKTLFLYFWMNEFWIAKEHCSKQMRKFIGNLNKYLLKQTTNL